MKIKKGDLRRIIREELTRVNEQTQGEWIEEAAGALEMAAMGLDDTNNEVFSNLSKGIAEIGMLLLGDGSNAQAAKYFSDAATVAKDAPVQITAGGSEAESCDDSDDTGMCIADLSSDGITRHVMTQILDFMDEAMNILANPQRAAQSGTDLFLVLTNVSGVLSGIRDASMKENQIVGRLATAAQDLRGMKLSIGGRN